MFKLNGVKGMNPNFEIEGLIHKKKQYSETLHAYKEALHKLLFNYNSRFE